MEKVTGRRNALLGKIAFIMLAFAVISAPGIITDSYAIGIKPSK